MAKFSDLPVIESLDIFLDDEDRGQRAGVAAQMEKELKAVTFSKEFVDAANGIIAAGDRVAKLEDQLTGRQHKMESMQASLDDLNEKMSQALESGDDAQVEAVVADIRKLEGDMDRLHPVLEMLQTRTIPAAKQDQGKVFEDFKAVARVEFSNIYDRKRKSLMAAAEKLNGESFAFKLAMEDAILTLGLKLGEFTETIHPLAPVAGQRLEVPLNKELAPVEGDYLGLADRV